MLWRIKNQNVGFRDSYESDGTWARLPEEERPQFPALQRACFEGRADVVRQLLARRRPREPRRKRGMPLLFEACGFSGVDTGREDYVGVVEALLEAGADATVANEYGNTPLHYLTLIAMQQTESRYCFLMVLPRAPHRRIAMEGRLLRILTLEVPQSAGIGRREFVDSRPLVASRRFYYAPAPT